MIIAGIDEAGYGPLLGPLVVGCCAFEVDVEPAPEAEEPADGGVAVATAAVATLPCVWSRLKRHVGRTRNKAGRKIHINDSKQVYSPSIGLKELERSILALAACLPNPSSRVEANAAGGADWPDSLDALLARVSPHCLEDLAQHPWYAPADNESFPFEQDGLPIKLFAKSLRAEMETNGARCIHLAARVLSEKPYNRMIEATRNKASVLFTQAATHLDHLLRAYGDRDLTIFCDRQGGRSSYGHLLRLMFEEWALEIVKQEDGWSEYLLTRRGNTVRIVFAEKAEAQCLPVAAASMLSKYLRETLMRRYNAWWKQHVPDIQPTAGYHPDGVRFAEQILAARTQLGIRDEDLLRSR